MAQFTDVSPSTLVGGVRFALKTEIPLDIDIVEPEPIPQPEPEPVR